MSTVPQALSDALAEGYRLERELGAGGMATVYLAEDLKHRRKVAVKVLRSDLAMALGAERFLREVTIAANLQHPHVLPLYDSGQAGGFLYYVMPYVEGPSLRQKLLREGELPIHDAVRILRDVADAMAYAHRHGVVHRDIKPENVMLSDRHALVTDFGVAKAVSEATGRQQITTVGVAIGTPSYMSPEQAAADPHVDHRADLYAFGAMAYELLTGRPPFIGATPQAVLAAHVTAAVEPVTNHRGSIPPVLAQLIMRCLEKKPADRWQTADEMIPALEAVLTPSGGMTPTATQPIRVASPGMPRRWALLAGGGVLAVAAVVYALTQGPKSATPGTPAPDADSLSVAVLPFLSRSPDTTDAYLAEAISEQIGSRLSRVGGLRVLSASAVSSQWRRTPDPVDAARALKVAWYVTGTLRRSTEELYAHVEVVRTASAEQAWSSPFRRQDDDLLALEGAVAESVVVAITGRLVRPAVTASTAGPRDKEAHRLFLMANALLTQRTAEAVIRAAKLYEEAVGRDSGHAAAWAGLGYSRVVQASWGTWATDMPRDSLPARARIAAGRALALDSLLPNAWQLRGAIGAWIDNDFNRAQADFARALSLDSLNPEVYQGLGVMYGADRLNLPDSAIKYLRQALALNPNLPNAWRHLGRVIARTGDLAGAEAVLDTTVGLGPWAPAHVERAWVRYLRGNGRGALEDLALSDRLAEFSDTVRHAIFQTLLGDSAEARRLVRTLPADAQHRLTATGLARVTLDIALGLHEAAMAGIRDMPAGLYTWASLHDPIYDPLRKDPEFQRVLRASKAAVRWDWRP